MLFKNLKKTDGNVVDILIENGNIKNVFDSESSHNCENQIDLSGYYVMSGLIDSHVHMREPGLTQKEDFYTGTKSAISGGITLVMDMPNTIPTVTTKEFFLEKSALLKGKSFCDYGLYFGGSKNNNSAEVVKVVSEKLSPYLKIFLNVSTGEMLVDDDEILDSLFAVGEKIFVHAEEEMVEKALYFSKKHQKQLTVCHVSKKSELEQIIKAKKSSDYPPVFAEVTPHHLTFTKDILNEKDVNNLLYRTKPELADKKDVDALWGGIVDGYIDVISTDHAPHLLEEKLSKLTFGMPSVEYSFSVMLTHFKNKNLPLALLEKLMSENQAKMLGLKNYGKLQNGMRGNLTIFNPEESWSVQKSDILSKCGWSPYENMNLTGKNYMTVIGGEIIFQDGENGDKKFNEKTLGVDINGK